MAEKRTEQGQALILVMVGMVALILVLGLVIDAAHSFADKSQAQNAVDAAAMAAAIANVSHQNIEHAALYQARNNGYFNDGINSQVEVFQPPMDGSYSCANDPGECGSYIQVKLTSTFATWFAPIIGIKNMTNVVSATARASMSNPGLFFDGSAVIALNKTDCRAVEFIGNNSTVITGSGIYVNSSCSNLSADNPQQAFSAAKNSHLKAPWLKTAGGAYYSSDNFVLGQPIVTGTEQLPAIQSTYNLPEPVCSSAGTVNVNNPSIANPGTYKKFPPAGVETLTPGIYCVDKMDLHSNLAGTDILIVLKGSAQFDTSATVHLKAKTTGDYAGLLFYMPPAFHEQIKLAWGSDSEFSGLILAPSGKITLAGADNPGTFNSQIIADTIVFAGNSGLHINYVPQKNYQALSKPRVELVH